MAVMTYSKSGAPSQAKVKLDSEVFSIKEINHRLIGLAYTAHRSNGRVNLSKSKTRGMVSGSNRKPWRQKGTGRARVGSKRTPIWRGGGIIFGPTGIENYSKKLNVSTKRAALRSALSALNSENRISIIEDLDIKGNKTKEAAKLINKLNKEGSYTLIVTDKTTPELKRTFSNLGNVELTSARYLNVAKLLNSDAIVITKPAVVAIEAWLKPAKKKEAAK